MKKIGIMTMQRIVNYGSFLQAYGLKKMIESLEYNVQFVDYCFEKPLVDNSKNHKLYRKMVNKFRNLVNIKNYLGRKRNDEEMTNMYKECLKTYLGVTDKRNHPYNDIDQLVIGSDEVFNCTQGYPVGYSKELFGKNYENIPVISYAACFGNTTLEMLNDFGISEEIGEMLNKFKIISARDSNTYNIVNHLSNTKIVYNLDPVLIYNYATEMIDNVKLTDYILIYAYPCRLSNDELKYIKKLAQKNNKKIVSIGGYQRIADYNLVVKPFELFAYFKHADFVITDTFHGTIFSIKNHSSFCTIVRTGNNGNNNKLIDLLNRLEQGDRIINNISDINVLYNKEIDYNKTDNIILNAQRDAINYLENNLINK